MASDRIAKVLALAASDNEAEALHALRTAQRLLAAEGIDFVELSRRLIAGDESEALTAMEDELFDLRAEVRRLRGEIDKPVRPPADSANGFGRAAETEAQLIRLRARLAELTADLEGERSQTLRLQASNANLLRQCEETHRLRQENRRLIQIAEAMAAEAAARAAECHRLTQSLESKPRAHPAPKRRAAGAPVRQYALF